MTKTKNTIKSKVQKKKVMIDPQYHSPLKRPPTKNIKTTTLTLAMRTCWTKRRLIQIFGGCWISFFPLAMTHLSWGQKLRFFTVCYHSSRKKGKKKMRTSVLDLRKCILKNMEQNYDWACLNGCINFTNSILANCFVFF